MFSWKGCRERREGIKELGIANYLSQQLGGGK